MDKNLEERIRNTPIVLGPIVVESSGRAMGKRLRMENIVIGIEKADRQRKGLTGDAAIAHYNEWMQRYGMEHLMMIKVPKLRK